MSCIIILSCHKDIDFLCDRPLLRSHYVVDINIFHSLCFNVKCCPAKARCCAHAYQIPQKAKSVTKKAH